MNILLTSVGGHLIPALVKAVRRQDGSARVVGVDAGDGGAAVAVLDRFARVPFGSQPGYAQAVLAVCRDEAVDMVVPGSDEEAFALAGARDEFLRHGIHVNVGDGDRLHAATDKYALYCRGRALGWSLPAFTLLRPDGDLREQLSPLGFPQAPVVIRPIRGRGSRDVVLLTEGTQRADHPRIRTLGLADFIREIPIEAGTLMASAYLPGDAYSIDVVADHGALVGLVARKCLNRWRIPYVGNEFAASAPFVPLVRAVVAEYALHGLVDLDVMLDADGRPNLIEINPRASGSLAASMTAGIPVLSALYAVLRGESGPTLTEHPGVRVTPCATGLAIEDKGLTNDV